MRPLDIATLLRQAVAVLAALGYRGAGVAIGSEAPAGGGPVFSLGAREHGVDDLIREHAPRLPSPAAKAVVACDGSDRAHALLERLGHVAVDVGPDPLPARFTWTPEERQAARERLERAQAADAQALLVSDAGALLGWAMAARHGAWQTSLVRPVLGVQLAALAVAGRPLTLAALTAPHVESDGAAEVNA
jgi:hypothetical protein